MSLVVDASVAFKWFLADEPNAAEAAALLRQEAALIAPDILVAEVCNSAWRAARAGRIRPVQAEDIAVVLPGLFDALIGAGSIAARAIAIARELDHPVYDCLYLSVSESRNAGLVTADTRLLAKVANTIWATRVQPLSAYPV